MQIRNPNDPRLAPANLDQHDAYILHTFMMLSKDRPVSPLTVSGQPTLLPISLQSIVNYQSLFNNELTEDEILLIQQLDDVYVRTIQEMRK